MSVIEKLCLDKKLVNQLLRFSLSDSMYFHFISGGGSSTYGSWDIWHRSKIRRDTEVLCPKNNTLTQPITDQENVCWFLGLLYGWLWSCSIFFQVWIDYNFECSRYFKIIMVSVNYVNGEREPYSYSIWWEFTILYKMVYLHHQFYAEHSDHSPFCKNGFSAPY